MLDLIEQCPTACRWREAASHDEDYIRQTNNHAPMASTVQQKWAPRMSEYDLQSMLLAHLANLVGVIAEGKHISKHDPIPAPRTAHDLIQAEQSLQSAHALIAMLTPHVLPGS